MSAKTVFWALISWKSAYDEVAYWPPSPPVVNTSTSELGSVTGKGRNSSESTSENIAVLTPAPSPSERTATAENPGLRAIQRRA